ncbi:MAG: hypothetical protein WBG30_12310 [Psychrilyobacter sp.]|uniref:hypothetical protein n=1 Tax=Psychrilyobacter sp. TaxID=2586924 RepID=UPI003C71F74D
MASTNKTSKGLSQFLGSDRLQREDYNNDMKKINKELENILTGEEIIIIIEKERSDNLGELT